LLRQRNVLKSRRIVTMTQNTLASTLGLCVVASFRVGMFNKSHWSKALGYGVAAIAALLVIGVVTFGGLVVLVLYMERKKSMNGNGADE
jgi:hypothetical protein